MESLGMYGGGPGYTAEQAMDAKTIGPMTMAQKLSAAVREAEKRLADAKRAKEILDAHPELEELLNILQRSRF